MGNSTIIGMIMLQAVGAGFDPLLAASIAKTESNFNPDAIGPVGEVGLFQLRPEYFKAFTVKELKDPKLNTILAIQKLKHDKKNCKHKQGLTWTSCYNMGVTGAAKLKHPHLFPYVRKVETNLNKMKRENIVYGPIAF